MKTLQVLPRTFSGVPNSPYTYKMKMSLETPLKDNL